MILLLLGTKLSKKNNVQRFIPFLFKVVKMLTHGMVRGEKTCNFQDALYSWWEVAARYWGFDQTSEQAAWISICDQYFGIKVNGGVICNKWQRRQKYILMYLLRLYRCVWSGANEDCNNMDQKMPELPAWVIAKKTSVPSIGLLMFLHPTRGEWNAIDEPIL